MRSANTVNIPHACKTRFVKFIFDFPEIRFPLSNFLYWISVPNLIKVPDKLFRAEGKSIKDFRYLIRIAMKFPVSIFYQFFARTQKFFFELWWFFFEFWMNPIKIMNCRLWRPILRSNFCRCCLNFNHTNLNLKDRCT